MRYDEKSPTASGSLILPAATALAFAEGLASNLGCTSTSQGSRNRFHWRHARKQLTRNTAAKKLTLQEDVDSDYLFGNFLELSAFSPLNIVIMPNNPQSDSVAHV
jgi:hypothetical protein